MRTFLPRFDLYTADDLPTTQNSGTSQPIAELSRRSGSEKLCA
jgi:hypothetical protein